VKVEIWLPKEYVEKATAIARIEGKRRIDSEETLSQWCSEQVQKVYGDKRRTTIPLKRVLISWRLDVYAGMVDHVGSGGVPHFVRMAVIGDLKEQGLAGGLTDATHLRESRRRNAKQRAMAGDPRGVQEYKGGSSIDYHSEDRAHPVAMPEDWYNRIVENWPNEVSTFVMSCAQTKLQKETGTLYRAKRTMKPFMLDYAED